MTKKLSQYEKCQRSHKRATADILKFMWRVIKTTLPYHTTTIGVDDLEKACDKITDLQAELDKHRWIPVEERLPEDANTVLLIVRRYPFVGCCRKGLWYIEDILYMDVTHWKPIDLPKGE